MYFCIHYENGTASFSHEISTPTSDVSAVVNSIEVFMQTVIEEKKESAEAQKVRHQLYDAVDEIIEDMYGYYDE